MFCSADSLVPDLILTLPGRVVRYPDLAPALLILIVSTVSVTEKLDLVAVGVLDALKT
jgi:hypothetical protein